MEAREIMEQGRGTVRDAAFVQQCTARWGKLLEGVNDQYTRSVMSILLENQYGHLKELNEDTLSTGVGAFTKYIFPILRRVFPNLIANQIVSVQPMTAPIGGVFTYEYKYDDTKGNATAGNNLIQDFQKFYTSEFIDSETKVAAGNVNGVKVVWSDGTNAAERIPFKWLPLRALEDVGSVEYSVQFFWTSGGVTKSQKDDGAGGFTGDGTPANSAVDYTAGTWTLDTTGDIPDNGTAIYATYWYNSELITSTTAPSAGVTGGTYANSDQVSKVPRGSLDISLETIRAISRKLAMNWSSEAVDDLRALHGYSAETQLVAGWANEMILDVDREIIDDLVSQASHSTTHALGPAYGGSNIHTELDSIRELVSKIDAVSAAIHKSTKRAPANFIVTSTAIGAQLGQLTSNGDFMMVNRLMDPVQQPSYGPMNSNFGVQRLGTLMNKYVVYQDPFLDDNTVLVGLKGANFLDAGYVYAPYVPMQVTPTWQDPNTFQFSKGVRTRYAKKMLRPEYYGKVTVSGLPTVTSL